MIQVSDSFRQTFPTARLGVLALRNVTQKVNNPLLTSRKEQLEEGLRRRYAGYDRARFEDLPVARAFQAHFGKVGRTYNLPVQLEWVSVGNNPIPKLTALMQALYMAEITNLVFTTGHDLDKVTGSLVASAAKGDERFAGIRGRDESCAPGDMVVADGLGVVSALLAGPDRRTRLTDETRNVLFVAYGPEGVSDAELKGHLKQLEEHIRLFSPRAVKEAGTVVSAGEGPIG